MKNFIKTAACKIKNNVETHKFGYGLMTGATLAIMIEITRAKQIEAYLVEKGIDMNDYYKMEDDVETSAS